MVLPEQVDAIVVHWPGCPPRCRPVGGTGGRFGVPGGSAEGGREELDEFWPSRASSSCTRACKPASSARIATKSSHRRRTRARASSSVWANGGSGSMRAVCRPAAAAASSGGRPLLSSLNPPRGVNDYVRSIAEAELYAVPMVLYVGLYAIHAVIFGFISYAFWSLRNWGRPLGIGFHGLYLLLVVALVGHAANSW
jgi:hypothetical protein